MTDKNLGFHAVVQDDNIEAIILSFVRYFGIDTINSPTAASGSGNKNLPVERRSMDLWSPTCSILAGTPESYAHTDGRYGKDVTIVTINWTGDPDAGAAYVEVFRSVLRGGGYVFRWNYIVNYISIDSGGGSWDAGTPVLIREHVRKIITRGYEV